jgi:hypothetical protein
MTAANDRAICPWRRRVVTIRSLMTLKAAILTALPPESIVVLALAAWPQEVSKEADSNDDPIELVRSYRERLRRSRRISLATTLLALNKEALVTICRVLGIDHRGRRDELTARLLEFDAASRPQRTRANASAKSRVAAVSAKTSGPKKESESVGDSRGKPRPAARANSRSSR